MENMEKNFYRILFKLKGLGRNKKGYNAAKKMDWLDEKNNLIFYSYVSEEDLQCVKKKLVKEVSVACFNNLAEAKRCMKKFGGVPTSFFIHEDDNYFYQDCIGLPIIKKIDKAYADFLVELDWTLTLSNFSKIKILKIEPFNENILKNNLKIQITNLKTKKI